MLAAYFRHTSQLGKLPYFKAVFPAVLIDTSSLTDLYQNLEKTRKGLFEGNSNASRIITIVSCSKNNCREATPFVENLNRITRTLFMGVLVEQCLEPLLVVHVPLIV